MRIAIIGAGFTGLAAAHSLSLQGHQVDVFEQDAVPGGLAVGFQSPGWDWPLEKHYHHLFVSDFAIRKLAEQVGVPIDYSRPVTSTYYAGAVYQLDSALSLLKFPQISILDRLRTGAGLALLKFNPFWQPLEKITAEKYITSIMGTRSWQVIWEPLFRGKFAAQAKAISASWFWARIYKRSEELGYPRGGFSYLAEKIAVVCQSRGVKFHYSTSVSHIEIKSSQPILTVGTTNRKIKFSAVICTLPSPIFTRIAPALPPDYVHFLNQATGIGAVNLVLALSRPFLPSGTYWLNINDRTMPFLAIVEHTNYIPGSHYAGDTLVYIGNYLSPDHNYFSLTSEQLLEIFTPHLKKINPGFSLQWVKKSWVWQAKFAQPIVTRNYSRNIPPLTTPLKNVYLANIQQVYPWDRGTNYAVELGQKVAELVASKQASSK